MPVRFRFEGFEVGHRFFTKRPYIKDTGSGLMFYPTIEMVARYGLLLSMVQTDYPMMLQEFMQDYATSRFIATAMAPDSLPARMFLTGDPERMLAAAELAATGDGSPI